MTKTNDSGTTMSTSLHSNFALTLLAMIALSGGIAAAQVTQPKAKAFFVFGDSYADTGNQPKSGLCQQPPYGITYPGYPSGRCGNGAIQTDFLADVIGLPSPTPYVYIGNQSSATGVNFAIAGSAITYALGVLPLGAEINLLELLVNAGVYSPQFLSESVVFISNAGNDYDGNFTTTPSLVNIVEQVLEGTAIALQRLYGLGLRNMIIGNLAPLNCLPTVTQAVNYTFCPNATDPIIAYHNQLLIQAVNQLNLLPDANIIILDENKAFGYLLSNPLEFGVTDRLTPCCKPNIPSANCGYLDANGNPLYTLCNDPSTHIYWDQEHPVQTAWADVIGLFANRPGFVIGASTLNSWLTQNALGAVSPAPAPIGSPIGPGAEGQLDRLINALILRPEYAESVGLLQDMNLADILHNTPAQTVTVFIPDNVAYMIYPRFFLDHIYGNDQVLPVIAYHVVEGFYNGSTLLASPPLNLTTVSNLSLPINPTPQGIFVGTNASLVTKPDLYVESGLFAVHGINKLLLPPNLVYT